uniref:G_PROTEIN_RECEP_F1_2 domain-containing protein n=1 Tax=Pristionchus pacificus TaxID=54126 RepID=A0A8R1UAD4_PRIPA
MMCIIPYLSELILYALIISILSDAKKGEFVGFRRFVSKKFLRPCQYKTRGKTLNQVESCPVLEMEDAHCLSLGQLLQRRRSISLFRTCYRAAATPPAHIDNSVGPIIRGTPPLMQDSSPFRASGLKPTANRRSRQFRRTSSSDDAQLSDSRTFHVLQLRDSHPETVTKLTSAPWVRTVNTARRNAKRKAFLMLSFNLIFWLPYCFHAIASSFVELNYFQFQFACALLVFNAITNILLASLRKFPFYCHLSVMAPVVEPLYHERRLARQDNQPPEDDSDDQEYRLPLAYEIERAMYAVAIVLGVIASAYTIWKFTRCCKQNRSAAARLLSYKISLSVADALILFVYAPTQALWITTFWWYGGDLLCRVYKFITTFAFYLTGNMQVLIAVDRLVTMAHLTEVHAKGTAESARLYLTIAWVLALVPSFPQLLVFKLSYVNDNVDCPQCASVWNDYNILVEIEHNFIIQYVVHMEGVDSDARDREMYNIVHISMMCIIPYLLELILYALIISILTDARKGEFAGVRRRFEFKWVAVIGPITASKLLLQNITAQMAAKLERGSDHTPGIAQVCRTQANANAPRSCCIIRVRALLLPYKFPPYIRTIDVRRQRFSARFATPCHVSSSGGSPPLKSAPSNRQNPISRPRSYGAAAAPPPVWVRTVDTVRRNAKRKAFLMLSFNLIFWLPYCFHAIASSFVELNYFQFQFACALVVFNAITNILL